MSYKLIRDNIPALAKEAKTPIKYATVEDPDFLLQLVVDKFKEEVKEVFAALNENDPKQIIEELADVMTVVGALAGIVDSKDTLNQVYGDKLVKNGGFDKHYILLEDDTHEQPEIL